MADLSDFDAANSEFSVGSLVVVDVKDRHHYGVIRWIGPVGPIKGRHITFAGIEMVSVWSIFIIYPAVQKSTCCRVSTSFKLI